MKATLDGNAVCITSERFTNLQESPALFYDPESLMARKALSGNLNYYERINLYDLLAMQVPTLDCPRWGKLPSGDYGPCLDCEACEIRTRGEEVE